MSHFHFKPIHIVLLAVCAVVLVVSVSMLVSKLISEAQSDKPYQLINEDVESIMNKSTETGRKTWDRSSDTGDNFWDLTPKVETATEKPTETETKPEIEIPTETDTETETEPEIEVPTETEKGIETEKPSESGEPAETEKKTETEKSTEKPTEAPTEAPTEKPTETDPETEPETQPEPEHSQKFLEMRALLQSLKKKNPDVWAYLYIEIQYPNTSNTEVISYPLMLTDNNSFYLDHAYDGSYSKSGAIFADCRCFQEYAQNRNIVIYGHNMAVGSMLHKLVKLYTSKGAFYGIKGQDPAYVSIQIFTMDAIYNYEVFAIYVAEENSDYRSMYFTSPESWIAFLEKSQNRSKWSKDITFYPNDRIITFSTCTNLTSSGRLAVQAILTSIEY